MQASVNLPFKLERRPGRRELGLVAAAIALVVLVSWLSPLGRWTELFSFDAMSVALPNAVPGDIVLVYLDERSHDVLRQPYDRPWDRRLHAQLVERLRVDEARLVYFDIVFEKPSLEPAADLEFAEAIRRHGSVILGGSIALTQEAEGIHRRVIAPLASLRQTARAWGTLSFFPIDSDYGVRQVPHRINTLEHAALHAARLLRRDSSHLPGSESRSWIHYFGPPGTFAAVSYHQALAPDGVPPGFFKGKVVLVGSKYSTGFSGSGKDSFTTPYSRFGSAAMSGVEVNANLLATLRSDRVLRRVRPWTEITVLLCCTIGIAWVLLGLRPASATMAVLAVIGLSSVTAWAAGTWLRIWGNWFLFAGGAVPAALVFSIGRNFYIERSRREKVTRAFEKYLSPEMVRHVVHSGMDLKPGGTTRRVTAMMTDIDGFSAIAERMSAEKVSSMLIAYFSRLTQHVFDHQGTVVQFVGDAIYCVWGAPLDQPIQADLAVRSALAIQASMHGQLFELNPLMTRIGISTGDGLCGNLGSAERFDYAVIGDNTNLAARIERANKTFGTRILISDGTKLALAVRGCSGRSAIFSSRAGLSPCGFGNPSWRGLLLPLTGPWSFRHSPKGWRPGGRRTGRRPRGVSTRAWRSVVKTATDLLSTT